MTSRFTLTAGALGLIWAGCSAPADGEIEDPPSGPPPGYLNGTFAGNSGQQAAAGTGGAPVNTGGTGGTPSSLAGSGGTGGAPVSTGGTGGAGGASGGGSIPTGTGLAIMHDATGWVAGSTNGLGIQGSFHTISDADANPPGDTQITLGDMAASPTRVCVSGTASAVPDDTSYGQYWGGGLGLNLADPGGNVGTGPWSRGTVTGFTFTVTGPQIPPAAQLRFKATTFESGAVNDDGYCTAAAAGANSFQLGSLVNQCWEGGSGTPPLGAATQLVSLQWQVATVLDDPTPFDFCIENLTAITTP